MAGPDTPTEGHAALWEHMLSPEVALPSPEAVSPLQVKLKPLTPQTEEEKIEHSIAAERRRMRLVHKDTLKDLLTSSPQETGTVSHSFQPQNSPDTHW